MARLPAQDNILMSVGASPLWLLACAHMGVVVHVLASYQVLFSMLF